MGTVGKPHGLRGAFFVSGRSEAIPPKCRQVLIGQVPDGTARVFHVASNRDPQGRPLMTLEECNDRTVIESMRGMKIWMPRADIELDEASEFLWSDVVGAEVYDASGMRMGTIVEMVNYGASDIAVIENDESSRVEIPFVGVYVDMQFSAPVARIDLLVEAAVFAEFWVKHS